MATAKATLKQWEFFCKEVAKANDTLDVIEKIFYNVTVRDEAYGPFFTLVVDALTTKVFLHLGHIFDRQDDALRLSRVIVDKEAQPEIERLKLEAQPFLDARHKQHAHISRVPGEINLDASFRVMNKYNSDKIKEILRGVYTLLVGWGVKYNNGDIIADRWGNITPAVDLLFEDLEEYEYIRSTMSTLEHVELRDRIMRAKNSHKVK